MAKRRKNNDGDGGDTMSENERNDQGSGQNDKVRDDDKTPPPEFGAVPGTFQDPAEGWKPKEGATASAGASGDVPGATGEGETAEPFVDNRPNATSRWCHCGATLSRHALTPPYHCLDEGSECQAFSLDTTHGQQISNVKYYY